MKKAFILNIFGVKNQLPTNFGTALVCNKMLKTINLCVFVW